jgi:hypothetical protein
MVNERKEIFIVLQAGFAEAPYGRLADFLSF